MFKFNKSPNTTKSPILAKFELSHVPFDEFVSLSEDDRITLAADLNLVQHSSWLLPQMLARFGAFKPIKSSTAEGKYSALETLKANIQDEHLKGMYLVATKMNRSALLKSQTLPSNAPYGTLVPLIPAALKKFQNIKYMDWDREELKYIFEKNLLKAMTYFSSAEDVPDFTQERLLELRNHGLTIKSGTKSGTTRSPLTTWTLSGMKGTEMSDYPNLLLTMLTQIWLAHPSVRNQYMVLDPVNWDNMPDPLIDSHLGIDDPKPSEVAKSTLEKDFWDV